MEGKLYNNSVFYVVLWSYPLHFLLYDGAKEGINKSFYEGKVECRMIEGQWKSHEGNNRRGS